MGHGSVGVGVGDWLPVFSTVADGRDAAARGREAGVTTSTTVSTFAMDAIFLGEMNAAGELRGDAWKSLGYDLDGKQTTKDSLDVCILAAGASKTNQVDGIGGRDNAFGSTVMQVFESLNDLLWPPDAGPPYLLEYEVRQGIAQGKFTLQIQIAGLSDDPAQTAVGLAAQVFTSDAFTGMPAFDQTTDWPVQPESLVDSTSIANGARARFASAYVTNGTFVAGTHESVTVPLRIGLKGIAFTVDSRRDHHVRSHGPEHQRERRARRRARCKRVHLALQGNRRADLPVAVWTRVQRHRATALAVRRHPGEQNEPRGHAVHGHLHRNWLSRQAHRQPDDDRSCCGRRPVHTFGWWRGRHRRSAGLTRRVFHTHCRTTN